jgi:murein DD-endopeptidase MepM/ murein hydrolase activator NlpD
MNKKHKARGATVVWHRDGALSSRSFYLSGWALRATVILGSLAVIFFFVLAVLYGPILSLAARVPGLNRDIAQLEADNAKVRDLAEALSRAESRYDQLREMLGADLVPEGGAFAQPLPVAPPIVGRAPNSPPLYESIPSVPSHWPIDADGYITRGQSGSNARGQAHPGLDVAIPIGSVVRAAGGGRVVETGDDEEYGRFVRLAHPDSIESMYGHLSRITVVQGDYVAAGTVIGLSGNSGRSSAPHLHFEVRLEGRSRDPLEFVSEGVQ